jgi:hypothetical protein
MMFNSRISAACIGMACVVASACPTATAASGVYGDPEAAAKYWQEQSLEVSITTFTNAWKTGEHSIVVTSATS